jgi:hypothetical protein
MNDEPLPMDTIEELAERRLAAEPLCAVENRTVDLGGLYEELNILEKAANQQYESGTITAGTRNGILIAVAGLRKILSDAQEANR